MPLQFILYAEYTDRARRAGVYDLVGRRSSVVGRRSARFLASRRRFPGWVPAAVTVAVVADIVASTFTAVVVAVWALFAAAFSRSARARAADMEDVPAARRESALA